MPVLTTLQRNRLESAVKQARKAAEQGAYQALQAMAVDHHEPFAQMDMPQRTLRNQLRSKARLLGDELHPNGIQEIQHLSYELAYETWHKMLFARFLEANNLLMHPDGVPVSLSDCADLARDEGFVDQWDAAAHYASRMLPAIFRTDDPLMKVGFAPNDRIRLEGCLASLDVMIFTADDALGWVYQFWQSEAKAEINASGDKIDGAKLPAVTQLFTEPYMVHFLIDNTLGAWWVSRNPGVLAPVKFEYLRLLDDGTPAAGKFEGWPDKTAEVTSLDPCMGSGHFVASLFLVFATLRMYEEGMSKEDATDKVIAENLHGLELDARCTQISAFNLALTAWKFCGHYKELPEMNLACSGIAPKGKVEDWVKLVGKVHPDEKSRMENGMRMLYEHFQLAPELGSLLDPATIKADVFTANFKDLQPVLKRALENEADNEQLERGVMAAGIAKAGDLLSKKYLWVITNVPYLGKNFLDKKLLDYVELHFPSSKFDLATVFIEYFINRLVSSRGSFSVVAPHNWLNIKSYKKFREEVLDSTNLSFISHLGSGAFSQITGEVVNVILLQANMKSISDSHFSAIDVSQSLFQEKIVGLCKNIISRISQKDQIKNPDTRIILGQIDTTTKLLTNYAKPFTGIQSGDNPKHFFLFWEFSDLKEWDFIQRTTESTIFYGGLEQVVNYQNGKGRLNKEPGAVLRNMECKGKSGFIVHRMGNLPTTIFTGELIDQNAAVIIPIKQVNYLPLWCYLSSNEYSKNVRKIDKKLGVTPATLGKVPFDLEHWQKIAAEKYPNGLPKPYSDDPTQWLFHGHPIKSDKPLQVAIARLLGYRWPAENDAEMELADEARTLIEQVKAFDYLSDEDGIFCIPSVNAEQAGADRLRTYLQNVFADSWGNSTITELLEKEGASSSNLEEWLRKEFFVQHCKVFQNRPFIWHTWDGRNDGFAALVNYHKLDKENLSKLIYTYLGDWIRMCEAKKKNDESGAEGLLSAALKLKEKLEAILHGEAPYDIFVRWKPFEQQPIGWEPDLNDGVRLNIRPFVEAGVLRNKFNVKWGVDRGKNPPRSPWGEIRDNDRHLSLSEKRIAREKSKRT